MGQNFVNTHTVEEKKTVDFLSCGTSHADLVHCSSLSQGALSDLWVFPAFFAALPVLFVPIESN